MDVVTSDGSQEEILISLESDSELFFLCPVTSVAFRALM